MRIIGEAYRHLIDHERVDAAVGKWPRLRANELSCMSRPKSPAPSPHIVEAQHLFAVTHFLGHGLAAGCAHSALRRSMRATTFDQRSSCAAMPLYSAEEGHDSREALVGLLV